MSAIVYFSQTGQTRKFVNKVQEVEKYELTADHFDFEMSQDFILVLPSYEYHVYPLVTDIAQDFLETAENQTYCKGLFGGGNRNFAELFGVTTRELAEEYDLPLLHLFEFQGSDHDVNKLKEELHSLESNA